MTFASKITSTISLGALAILAAYHISDTMIKSGTLTQVQQSTILFVLGFIVLIVAIVFIFIAKLKSSENSSELKKMNEAIALGNENVIVQGTEGNVSLNKSTIKGDKKPS